MRIAFLPVLFSLIPCHAQPVDPVFLVNPFVGTDGHGHTFPGATVPFGMVQLSPDTRVEGWDACGGYHYSDSMTLGFSHTHLSGTGIGDYGDILFVPQSGRPHVTPGTDPSNGYRMRFRHADERAWAGYYEVHLREEGIRVELSASTRTAMHRYSFDRTDSAWLLIDLVHGIGPDVVLDSYIRLVTPHEVAGMRRSRGWAKDQVVYFSVKFSSPVTALDIYSSDLTGVRAVEGSGTYVKGLLRFGELGAGPLIARIGLSAVDEAGAANNLHEEMHHWNFDSVRTDAEKVWRSALGRIRVEGGSISRKRTFYTSLYRSFIAPNVFSDVDGRFRTMGGGADTARGFDRYTVFSLWDTFRAAHPLFTILEPDRTNDFVNTFLDIEREGTALPVWELASNETWTMIGYHSVPVIADAYLKGIQGYDAEAAFAAMKRSANLDHFGLKHYRLQGYVPAERESESVSKTLEYAYDDWCISAMAVALGKPAEAEAFGRRAESFRNVFDRTYGFARARVNGSWRSPFDPRAVTIDYTEANAWQYTFFAPHNVAGLIEMYGGKGSFVAKLDELFASDSELAGRNQADITGLIGQYAHGNEPSHHMAYLYAYAGQPWKTQGLVRRIRDDFYSDEPDGLIGNEDCGQMSSWYVLSALGFYPVTPGQPNYVLGIPLFEAAEIALPNGRRFAVRVEGREKDFVQSVSLNGNALERSWISHEEILAGGELTFVLGPEPNKSWAVGPTHVPPSPVSIPIVLTPVSSEPSGSFQESLTIRLRCGTPGAVIRYTTNGRDTDSTSQLYSEPIRLASTVTLSARSFVTGMVPSGVMKSEYVRMTSVGTVLSTTNYSPQYSAGGDQALVDGVRGVEDFRVGNWQGYEGVDLEAVIDLASIQTVSAISTRFLHDNNAWIFYPSEVSYAVSDDGAGYREVWRVATLVPPETDGSVIKEARFDGPPVRGRYIRIRAKNLGVCPSWHKGAGGKAWIFVDEVEIEKGN